MVSGPLPPPGDGRTDDLRGESFLADSLLRRLGSPGLIDSAAVQDEVLRKLGWPNRQFPLLHSLLARAAAGGVLEPPGAAMPLAASLGFVAGDRTTTAATALDAPQIQPLPADGAPRHLVRVSRQGNTADAALALPLGAAAGGVLEPAGAAMPMAASPGLVAGDRSTTAIAAPDAPQMPLSADGAPGFLVRVSGQGNMADAASARPLGATAGGVPELAGGATPMGASLGFVAGDRTTPAIAAPDAPQMPLSADGAPSHLVRVSRGGNMADAASALTLGRAGSPQPPARSTHTASVAAFERPGTTAVGPAPSGAARQESGAAVTRLGHQTTAPDVARPLSGAPPPLAATGATAPRQAAETNHPGPNGMRPPVSVPSPTVAIGPPNWTPDRGSPAVSHTARVPADLPLADALPLGAAFSVVPHVPELRAPRGVRPLAPARALPLEAESPRTASANQTQMVLTVSVPELRRPIEARRPGIGTEGAPPGRATTVSESSRSVPRETPLVLPARVAEARRRIAGSRPAEGVAADPAAPDRGPVRPNSALPITPRPAAPAAALAGAELERLADKVGRIIARRVAVERERRGR
jgi:hypothetical protein